EGFALFDSEAPSIRQWQRWAARAFAGDHGDPFPAELCRDYALVGGSVFTIRLAAGERIAWLRVALDACRLLKDRARECGALGNLANAYFLLGDFKQAATFHEQALVISRELGLRKSEGQIFGGLGNCHAALGDLKSAITLHEQQLVIAQEVGD